MWLGVYASASLTPTVLKFTLMFNHLLVGEWLATAFQDVVFCVSKLNAYGVKVYLGVKSLVGEWLATAIFNIVSVFSRQQA
ncbi:hypothetical protein H5201_21610 [Pseudoalteromonas sp. SG43-6]|uniref:hypothetical protein n=1 Tax=Pseudoalteromonas sp. SG43-6 TaxID=2760967 RepID=UPI001600FB58|nr:hypothetical protein [Pseudoalteromonas sp. SG43-6]MBB1436846.1 hypothetical protein [Pseudoalteromonas sp. SG43-6]